MKKCISVHDGLRNCVSSTHHSKDYLGYTVIYGHTGWYVSHGCKLNGCHIMIALLLSVMGKYTHGLMLAFSTHSVLVAEGCTCVCLTFSSASSVPAICDTGHEAVVEGIRKPPHHLVHAFGVCPERITNTQGKKTANRPERVMF